MSRPNLELERELWAAGCNCVAGLDEVGRGAWAGPVVAAAVILPKRREDLAERLGEVRDSKALSQAKRLRILPGILATSQAVGIGMASAHFIDRWGIVQATRQAMLMAVHNLPVPPCFLLIDALRLSDVQVPQRALIKGDAHVLSIAAASIVAKVFRDRVIAAHDVYHPGYGFAAHKGYGTPAHRAALNRLGPCPEHRMSFAPLRRFTQCGRA